MAALSARRRRSLTLGILAGLACAPAPLAGPPLALGCRTTVGSAGPLHADTVAWRVAAEPAQAAALDDRCRDVGPAVVVQPERDAHAALDSLAIVSWNVHIGAGDLGGFVRDLRDGSLTGGRPVREFVILAQEARRGGSDDVVAAARELGLSVYYAPSMRSGVGAPGAADRGNAILSTLPLSDLEAVELPLERQRRVAILATVRLGADAVPVRLVNVHLETISARLPDTRSTGAGRRAQMDALLRTVRLGAAAVLAGDLNTWAYESAEPVIRDLVATHGFRFTPLPADEPTLVALFGVFTRQLDYVFFRLPQGWSGRSARIPERYGSDHHPLLAWIRPAPPVDVLPVEPS